MNDQRLCGSHRISCAVSSSLSDGFTVDGGAVGTGLVGTLRQNGPLQGNGIESWFEAVASSIQLALEASELASLIACCALLWDWPECTNQSPQDAKARISDAVCSSTKLSNRISASANER